MMTSLKAFFYLDLKYNLNISFRWKDVIIRLYSKTSTIEPAQKEETPLLHQVNESNMDEEVIDVSDETLFLEKVASAEPTNVLPSPRPSNKGSILVQSGSMDGFYLVSFLRKNHMLKAVLSHVEHGLIWLQCFFQHFLVLCVYILMKETYVRSYFSYVKYVDLCATLNSSTYWRSRRSKIISKNHTM